MGTIFDRYNAGVESAIDEAVSGKAPKPKTESPPGTLSKGVAPTDEEKRKRLEDREKALKARGYSQGGSIDGCAQRGKTRARR
jgi:hypothetical protein